MITSSSHDLITISHRVICISLPIYRQTSAPPECICMIQVRQNLIDIFLYRVSYTYSVLHCKAIIGRGIYQFCQIICLSTFFLLSMFSIT